MSNFETLHAQSTSCDDQAKSLLDRFMALLVAEEAALVQFRYREIDAITAQKLELESELANFVTWLREHPSSLSPRMRELWRTQAALLRRHGERNLMRLSHSMTLIQGLTQRLTGTTPSTYTARRGLAYTTTARPLLTCTIG